MGNIYIALLHYPVYNKKGDVITTAVTNMDIHDISRSAKTYGIKRFYIVTPVEEQRELVRRIIRHWQRGYGASYNPLRKEAMDIVDLKGTLEEVLEDISAESKNKVRLVVTGAELRGKLTKFAELKRSIAKSQNPCLLVFGTGWGIASGVIGDADFFLEPIKGPSNYNHMSVRSAVAVVLDRLLGERS